MKYVLTCLAILSASAILTGCAQMGLQRSLAGKIGCPAEEIKVLNTDPGFGVVPTTMTAECRGQKFICSGVDTMNEMSCSQLRVLSDGTKVDPNEENLGDAREQSFDDFLSELNAPPAQEKPVKAKRTAKKSNAP